MRAQDKLRALATWLGVTPEWLRFGEGDAGEAAAYRVRESTGPAVDFDLAREIGALSPVHQAAVRVLVKALKRGEAKLD